MRSLYIHIFPALLFCFSLNAQDVQLVSGEYFIGEDPGLGLANPITFTPSDTTNLLFEVDTDDLEPGFYFLYMRFKDNNGNWSLTQKSSFRVYQHVEQQFTAVNIYIYDTDDALVESFTIPVDLNLLDTIYHVPTLDLTPGRYWLVVSTLDEQSGLEIQSTYTFLVRNSEPLNLNTLLLDAFQGQNINFNILDSAIFGDTIDMVLSFSVDSLPLGYFQLNSTLMSSNSSLSFPYQRHTKGSLRKYDSKPQYIEKLEFFYNTDPGLGNGIVVEVDHVGDTLKLDTLINSADLPLGVHQVFVRALADNGTWSHTFHVGQLEIINCSDILLTTNVEAVSCYAGEDGVIELTTNVPELDYLVFINDVPAEMGIESLGAGTYFIEVRSPGETCIFNDTLQILEPDPFTAEIDSIAHVSCPDGTNGSATISIEGGVLPYSISWDNDQTGETLQNVGAGTYAVLVLDANNCPAVTDPVVITAPDSVSLDMASVMDASCFGITDGAISATLSGGIGTLEYSWLLNNSPLAGATTNAIEDLAPGNYILIVSYNDGLCTETTATFTITQPDEIVLANAQTEDALCFDDDNGSISVTINGGIAPYTYLWNDGDSTAIRENLAAGSYSLSVTDANDCIFETGPFIIDEPDLLEVEVAVTQEISCYQANDGIAASTVLGGTGPYTYTWSNGANTAQISGLSPGNYSVVVSDLNACSASSVEIIVSEPDSLELTITAITDAACFDEATGSIEVQGAGGTGAYTFAWSTGASGSALTNITAGLYSVTITDANNCSESISDIEIIEPDALSAELIQVDEPLCNGLATGSIELSASGGTGQLSYLWSNGAQTANIQNLQAGSYELIITDENDCTLDFGPVEIEEPDALEANVLAEAVSCFGEADGSVELIVSGGVAPYTILWSNGENGLNLENLLPGSYSATITDDNDCMIETFSAVVEEPDVMEFESMVEQISCFGFANGSIGLMVAGGIQPYHILWNTGDTASIFSGLEPGTYEAVITDVNGCELSFGPVTIDQPDDITAEAEATDETDQLNDGNIDLNIGGGTEPYEVNWAHGATGPSLNGLTPGVYTYTVTDANGCTLTGEVEISPYVSVSDAYLLKNWELFPNPANNQIEVKVNDQLLHYRLELTDALGRSLYSVEITDSHSVIPVSHLSAGFYTITIFGDQGISTRQLIISR